MTKKKCFILTALMGITAIQVNAENLVSQKDTIKVIDIEEVVVISTPKENTRLRQQALSSTSFSQEDILNQSVTSVKSLTGLVPTLFIPDYGSKLTTAIYMRGIGSRTNTPAVGLYVDNIPFIDKSAFDFNYFDIERIDVIRGPQGTLYGRNTMGGLIRIFTKSPFTYQGTDVLLSAATYNNYKAALKHYHRISEEFAFSAGLFYEHKGGFFKNTYNGQRIDTDDEFGGRMRAIYLPHENLKIDFTLNYEYTHQGGYPYAYAGRTDGEEEDRSEYIGTISYDRSCGYKRNLLNGGLNIEHHASGFILSSVTGFQYLHDRMDMDQDFTEKDIYTLMQKQDSKILSQELVLKSNLKSRWQWTTGVSGFYQWMNTDGPVTFYDTGISTLIEDNINEALSGLPAGAPTLSAQITTRPLLVTGNFRTPVLNGAIYHQSTLNDLFTEGLSLTVGLRLDYEKMKLDYDSRCDADFDFGVSASYLPVDIVRSLNALTEFIGKESTDYLQLLPKFTLQYAWKQHNVYATVSKGYRSGGYNIQMFSDLVQSGMRTAMIDAVKGDEVFQNFAGMMPDFSDSDVDVSEATLYKPEYSWNYEVGTHLTLCEGRLHADAALFYMDTHDQQLSRLSENGLGRITVNAGKSRSMGAEISLRTRVTDAFNLGGSYGYTYATFTDYVVDDDENYNGHYVPFVPKHTFQVNGEYRFVLWRNALFDNITVNANYKAAGRIYWTEENNASQSLYDTLDGRISFNKGKGQIGCWITNALNKKYQAFYFESMNRGFYQEGRPLQVGIDLRCNF